MSGHARFKNMFLRFKIIIEVHAYDFFLSALPNTKFFNNSIIFKSRLPVVFYEKVFLKTQHNSQENTCVGIPFIVKL